MALKREARGAEAPRLLPWLLLALLLGAAGLRLSTYASVVPFDYDEVAEAHAVWLKGQGSRPFQDFYYDHAPYSWLVWAPVLKVLPEAFESLVILRWVNGLLGLLALGLLVVLVRDLARGEEDRPSGAAGALAHAPMAAAVVAVLVMATNRSCMTVLHQFRGDQLSLVLTLLGLLCLETRGRALGAWRAAAAGLCFVSGLLITPKLVLLCGLAVVLHGARLWREGRGLLKPCLAGFCAGAGLGLGLWNAWAFAAGVDPRPFYRLVVAHHLTNLTEAGYAFGMGRGLFWGFSAEPAWFAVLAAGLAGGILAIRRRGVLEAATLTALSVFCLVQPLWVKYPWNQYLYTVCLFWSAPLAVFLLQALKTRRIVGWTLLAAAAAGFGLQEASRFSAGADKHTLAEHIGWCGEVLAHSIPGRSVAVQPPLHPVFRRDATYVFNFTVNPRGRDTEEALRRVPVYGSRFSYEGYMEQLEASPPAIILASPYFTGKEYMRAVLDFVRVRHPKAYRKERVADLPAYVRATGW